MAVVTLKTVETMPRSTYLGKVADVQVADGKFGPQAQFTIDIIGDNYGGKYAGKQLKAWTSLKFSMTLKCKLYRWALAILGAPVLAPGYTLNTDDLIGRTVLVDVDVETGADGAEYNKVAELRAYKPKSAQSAAAQTAAPRPAPVTVAEKAAAIVDTEGGVNDDSWWDRVLEEGPASGHDDDAAIF